MYLWVVYGDDGLPEAVFDSAQELAEFLGVTHSTVYYRMDRGDLQIARIKDEYDEDEESPDEI